MKKLLLVIDMQKGWRHPTATEEVMMDTVDLCKTFDGDVIHCRFRNDPESLFYKQLKWYRFTNSPDIDEIPEIAELKLPNHWRSAYSCVTEELLPMLKAYDHIYIAGVFTDISVAATAMHLFDLGITVSVVADCVGTLHGEDAHELSLRSIGEAIGKRQLVTADSLRKQN